MIALSSYKPGNDIISRLGMSPSEAKKNIFGNMVGDFSYLQSDGRVFNSFESFKIPTAKLIPEIIKSDKVGAAKELCNYVKMYCNSEEFINDYSNYRNMYKPASEPVKDANITKANESLIKINKDQIAMYEKYLADAKKKKDANSVALYEKALTDLRKSVAGMEDPTPNKTAWEKKYPIKPDAYVKVRLEEYLALTASVDFSAQLTVKGNKMIFVNSEYEKKGKKWKAIYRAGKEVNDVVTAFVKEWLKGEIIASVKTKMSAGTEKSRESKD